MVSWFLLFMTSLIKSEIGHSTVAMATTKNVDRQLPRYKKLSTRNDRTATASFSIPEGNDLLYVRGLTMFMVITMPLQINAANKTLVIFRQVVKIRPYKIYFAIHIRPSP